MKKKVTNEEVSKVIGTLAEKIRDDMDYDYRVAFGQMGIAEKILVNSFDDNQMKLYKDFCEKREAFYIIASEIYQRKF